MASEQNGNEQDRQSYGDEFRELLESTFEYLPPQRGEIRSAVILQIDRREIIVDLGAKRDGIVPVSDLERLEPKFRDSLRVGAEIPVYVMNPRDQDDNLIVSINMGLQQYDWEKARALLTSEEVVEVTVKGHNRGGILVNWNRLEGFIPSSHLITTGSSGSRDTWDDLVGTGLVVKVIEVDQSRRRLIFSEREAQREWRAQQKARLLAELKESDIVRGTVTGLRDFGAFVNLGGADGLIHVSELAWHRVDHPRDVLKVGDNIEVYVLSLDKDTNRIALSRKRLLPDPWEVAQSRYHEGQLVDGTVTNVVDFGAFVALDDGLEGLLHLSEMGDGSLKEPYSYVKKGDRLSLRISHLEPEKRRVGFTQRWGTDLPPEGDGGTPAGAAAPVETESPVDEAAPVEPEAPAGEAAPVEPEAPAEPAAEN
ncbi:MAG: S1 RNA-binding domain-containing protein [Anaerolineae bacterium]|nr:S1 RNA-binding domain-containing protein [Anaerolineae bacterium]NUQ05400.1 S1 RNA-binding domain-containing protein [Anaerolineae bacterium]